MNKETAIWEIGLYVACPHCNVALDLMNDAHYQGIQVGESKENVEMPCEKCGKDFMVDIVY